MGAQTELRISGFQGIVPFFGTFNSYRRASSTNPFVHGPKTKAPLFIPSTPTKTELEGEQTRLLQTPKNSRKNGSFALPKRRGPNFNLRNLEGGTVIPQISTSREVIEIQTSQQIERKREKIYEFMIRNL